MLEKNLRRTGAALALYAASAAPALSETAYQLETITSDLHHPWSVAFLPGGQFLVTERRGQLLHISADGQTKTPVSGVPQTYVAGQGGFFDIVLHPDFNRNRQLFLSYAEGTPEENGTAVMRATLDEHTLQDTRQILRVKPDKDTPQHYGGRLLFLEDETLLVATGDGFEYREAAQDQHSELGKVLRIKDDGSVPADNPLPRHGEGRMWSYGHRNTQGLALNPATGTIYQHEHGPRGGDELNTLEPGNNYGWPAITYGVNYSGAYVSPYTELPGMEQPLTHWTPSVGPSGLAYYDGAQFPEWRGDLLIGTLVNKDVRRIDLEAGKVVGEHILFAELGERIRDVRVGADGFIYLLTDAEQGKLIRVKPVN